MGTASRALAGVLCALGSVLCLAATATPLMRIVPTPAATGLPLFGQALSRLPAIDVDATPGARTGFVVAALAAVLAALLALMTKSRLLVALVAVCAAAFPAVAAGVCWHTITGGPDALSPTGSSLLERLGTRALALLERTGLATLHPAAGTICLTVGAALLVLAALTVWVGGAQRGTRAQ